MALIRLKYRTEDDCLIGHSSSCATFFSVRGVMERELERERGRERGMGSRQMGHGDDGGR